MKILCPYGCGARVKNKFSDLADHIFIVHNDNMDLVSWARYELEKLNITSNGKKPKFMGRTLDRIPPSRKDKVSDYLKKQME